ncbi:uncharacterized protein LOC127281143 [Leptopilina boulardi]|uniref:uncharacterized protein LOC127281143 n=1 Tax=Leptopilina boulardi TaxID=63433 RepID=UPI0021F4FE9A|nr:uncharacterized protein LOC127281143 [Leptopilina boulardi]
MYKNKIEEMEENLTGDEETCEEGIDGYEKFVTHDDQVDEGTIEYLDMDMEIIQEADDECHQTTTTTTTPVTIIDTNKYTQKKRQRSKETKSITFENKITPNELKLRPKYRPIRPKPSSQLNSVTRTTTNKLQNLTPIVNFNTTPGFIVTAPSSSSSSSTSAVIKKEKGHETYVSANSIVNNRGITLSKMMTNGAGIVGNKDNNNLLSTTTLSSNELQNGKVKLRNTPKNSVELFFESMAKTVLNLPTHIQAEIKMEICRVVTMAEIKYLSEEGKNVKKD